MAYLVCLLYVLYIYIMNKKETFRKTMDWDSDLIKEVKECNNPMIRMMSNNLSSQLHMLVRMGLEAAKGTKTKVR